MEDKIEEIEVLMLTAKNYENMKKKKYKKTRNTEPDSFRIYTDRNVKMLNVYVSINV